MANCRSVCIRRKTLLWAWLMPFRSQNVDSSFLSPSESNMYILWNFHKRFVRYRADKFYHTHGRVDGQTTKKHYAFGGQLREREVSWDVFHSRIGFYSLPVLCLVCSLICLFDSVFLFFCLAADFANKDEYITKLFFKFRLPTVLLVDTFAQ